MGCSVLHYATVCYIVLQCFAVCVAPVNEAECFSAM